MRTTSLNGLTPNKWFKQSIPKLAWKHLGMETKAFESAQPTWFALTLQVPPQILIRTTPGAYFLRLWWRRRCESRGFMARQSTGIFGLQRTESLCPLLYPSQIVARAHSRAMHFEMSTLNMYQSSMHCSESNRAAFNLDLAS